MWMINITVTLASSSPSHVSSSFRHHCQRHALFLVPGLRKKQFFQDASFTCSFVIVAMSS
jgi:hypothetical protein